MNPAPGMDTGADGDGGRFDPAQAAALLDETTQQARRRLEPAQPWLLATRAVVALGVLGAVWLNVRGQHPYQHPTAAVVPVAVGFGILNTVVTVAVARRATAGVTGRSRYRPAEIAGLVTVWVIAYAVIGILAANGVSDSVAYGLYPAAVPLMAGGLAWAGIAGARADWHRCAVGLAVAVTGAIALSAGPAGAWAVDGAGLCVTLLGAAAAIVWQQRRRVVSP
jgi:hypothetical protein